MADLAKTEIKLNGTDDEVLAVCQELGVDPTQLSNDEITIVNQALDQRRKLSKQGTKSVKQRNSLSTRKDRATAATATQKAGGIQNVAQQTDAELGSIAEAITAYRNQFVADRSEELVEIVAETPNLVLAEFGRKASEFQGDPEFFRARGEDLATSIFGNL